MKRIVDLERFVNIAIGQLVERINREIEAQSQYRGGRKARVLLNECMSFFASDAVGELAVSLALSPPFVVALAKSRCSYDVHGTLISSEKASAFSHQATRTRFSPLRVI